jgi:signal transduction histidine kinase
MLNIINGLLAAAALEDGTVALDIATCDVTTVVRSVVSLNEASAKHKGITVLVDSEQGCTIEADVQRMQELIDNLVSNAIKYSSPGSRAWVSVVRSSPESIRISVRDEGPGLTPEDMQKLFGKFQKLSARPTGGESSTGLGLAIAKTIVELHGGRIWAESKPGCGATFFVDLPVRHEVKG